MNVSVGDALELSDMVAVVSFVVENVIVREEVTVVECEVDTVADWVADPDCSLDALGEGDIDALKVRESDTVREFVDVDSMDPVCE